MSHVTVPLSNRQPESVTGYGALTDVGKVRDHNEDNYLASPPLFAVADGMGGHEAGEVASEIAIRVLSQQAPTTLDAEALSVAVETANYAILQAANDGRGAYGMGTTLTAAMVEGERMLIAQVGDSRAYLLHQNRLQQITRDHSLMADMIEAGEITPEQAKYHPQRSVITRALGSSTETFPDIYELTVAAGDRLLLCSDGLSGMVEDADIAETLGRVRNPQKCCEQLVKQALHNGGHDNVTVVVVDIEGDAPQQMHKAMRKSRRSAIIVIALMAAVLGGAFWGFNNWLNTAAFLADNNGYVAIYQGIPDEFLGFSHKELVEVTNIPTDKLNAGLAKRLREECVKADSVEEARRLADGYREDASALMATSSAANADNTSAGNATSTSDNAPTDESADE